MAGLTKKQRQLVAEIDEIADEMNVDYRVLVEELEGEGLMLTTYLDLAKRRLIISAIVHEYTFIDEMLGTIISRYFFGAGGGSRIWRTKRFQRFNYFVLERLYVLQKLALVRDIRPLPKETVTFVEKVNDLRNAVAHAFFPENLRGPRTTYEGLDIFTVEGFMAFREDHGALDPIFRRAFGFAP